MASPQLLLNLTDGPLHAEGLGDSEHAHKNHHSLWVLCPLWHVLLITWQREHEDFKSLAWISSQVSPCVVERGGGGHAGWTVVEGGKVTGVGGVEFPPFSLLIVSRHWQVTPSCAPENPVEVLPTPLLHILPPTWLS